MTQRHVSPATAAVRQANRAALARENLVALGYPGDIDLDATFFFYDSDRNDWTLGAGVTTEAATSRGVLEAAQTIVVLDAQTENAYVSFSGGNGALPVGTYLARLRLRASASVAGDVGIKVDNVTDATSILAEATFDPYQGGATTFGYLEVLFTVRSADSGDSLRLTVTKKTASANTIRLDLIALHPIATIQDPYGKVPKGGSIVYAYTGDDITGHTIYDGPAGSGNAIETATWTYSSGDLSTIAYTRDGKTVTDTYTYDGSGNLSRVART